MYPLLSYFSELRMAMRNKILLSAAFIIFAATIFFYPVKQFSQASVLAQQAEAEQEPEPAEITGNQPVSYTHLTLPTKRIV